MDVPFTIVDVFAERRYAGNQLAVVRNAAALPHDEMQAIARETNFSETTFVVDDKPTVKIFTPREEIPFAGHPTLGTASVLMEERGVDEVTLQLKVGPIRVRRAGDGVLWMRQNPPAFGARHAAGDVAAMLGLREADVDPKLPIEDVSTGLMHTLVPLASPDAVARVKVDLDRYWQWCERSESKSIMVFAEGGAGFVARVFPIYYGIAEDPATGSANGCLAGYLAKHVGPVDARVEQGAQVGRPSLIHLRAKGGEVDVGGRVVRVVEGRLVR
jgi:trans-2,3-dihydro-3-hydroxyanthranilate isomerase